MAEPRYDVNCSILFLELPLLERAAAARAAGFDGVEFWWPFSAAVPPDREVDAFVRSVRDAGVALVSLNAYGGDLTAGERGLASVPGREAEFADSLDAAVGVVRELDCPGLHVLYGRRSGDDPDVQDQLATEHLGRAARAAAEAGAVVLVEALSGVEGYPLRTAADVAAVLDRVGSPDLRMLCDLYHLAVNGDDLLAVVEAHVARIGHVQIADAPGRHQPGTGRLDLAGPVEALYAAGYDGWVGLEYVPLGPSVESFDWLPPGSRGANSGAVVGRLTPRERRRS